jgi:hypothetical protein
LFYQETIFIGDSRRCIKEGSGNGHFSAWGNLQAGSLTEDFERWMKKGYGNGVPL